MNITDNQWQSMREQIQEDILGWTDSNMIPSISETELCQIIVDNFKKMKEEITNKQSNPLDNT